METLIINYGRHELLSCYMRSRFTQLAMNVQVELKTEISVKIKSAAFVIFIIASCSIGLEMPIRIALYGKISLPVSFINGQGQFFWNFPWTDASQLG